MASLTTRVRDALDEARILILGCQVLVGFAYRAVFEPGFDGLPDVSKHVKIVGLVLMLAALGLLMLPAAYHRIACPDGADSRELHVVTTRALMLALLPFALGLGGDLYVATQRVAGEIPALVASWGGALTALFFWYGLEGLHRRSSTQTGAQTGAAGRAVGSKAGDCESCESEEAGAEIVEGAKLEDRIKHALTEARMVLPGAQALLGFQFASILTNVFERLPMSLKVIHLGSLFAIALATIFLMAPAAYHRIVENGAETERFLRFTSGMVLAAMVPLAVGVSGDLFVVIAHVTGSYGLALSLAGVVLLSMCGLWFGFTFYCRARRERSTDPGTSPATHSPGGLALE